MSTPAPVPVPVALSIAGSDPSGGAGIQADLKTFSALGVYGTTVLTALTAQNTRGVTGVHLVPADFVRQQIRTLHEDVRIDAIKIGMVATAQIAGAVADALEAWPAPRPRIVLDPVMVARSGDRLLATDAVAVLRDRLLPLADVLTPNLPEAMDLLDRAIGITRGTMVEVATALRDLGPAAVLLKGGHLGGERSDDVLVHAGGVLELPAARIDTVNTHGTGCTLSAALAARLAAGRELPAAAGDARAYVTEAIRAADRLGVGGGHGPTHHFSRWWPVTGDAAQ
jgi:hydroxymethylpyrimidine/phosphomethylpyrimidine kinase